MSTATKAHSHYWLQSSHWLFVAGSLIAGIVALIAEGPGDYIGLILLCICVSVICLWSLTGTPSLYWTVSIVAGAILLLGWTVEEPEPVLFQSILITAAVGWRVDRLSISIGLLVMLVLLPLIGSLGQNQASWGWWNWSVGTIFTWSLGRVIRLLEHTLIELTEARAQLIDSASREERLRISRDVHDLVGHSLTAMLLNIRAAIRVLDSNHQEARQALSDAERVGTTGISDIRAVLMELRSDNTLHAHDKTALSSLPDGETIMELLEQQSHIAVSSSGDVAMLKGSLAVAVYRILQECITNCSKYAQPGTATITLVVDSDEIILSSCNALVAGRKSPLSISDKTLGLISMRERASSLGGEFKAGVEGANWQVQCNMPRHD